jgi:hypothetical protein
MIKERVCCSVIGRDFESKLFGCGSEKASDEKQAKRGFGSDFV